MKLQWIVSCSGVWTKLNFLVSRKDLNNYRFAFFLLLGSYQTRHSFYFTMLLHTLNWHIVLRHGEMHQLLILNKYLLLIKCCERSLKENLKSTPLDFFRKANMLPVPQLYTHRICLYAHHTLQTTTIPARPYNTRRSTLDLSLPFSTFTIGHRQPSYQASAARN